MISIFAKPPFLNIRPAQPFIDTGVNPRRGQLMRVSSLIRGNQIAEKIGAKLNPKSGYENDICIYVKPMVRKGHDFNFEGKPYMDIIDGHALGELMRQYPKIPVIVCSEADKDVMSSAIANKIVFIPQHHCNFERVKRTRKHIKNIGVIGTRGAYNFLPKGLEKEIENRGMKLIFFSRFFRRQDIIDFYKKVDIQMVWRPYKKILSNPLKLINAASFGIPTVALDEKAFHELEGHYIPVHNTKEFFVKLDRLRENNDMYQFYSEKCINIAEKKYHIDKVAEIYKELK